MLRCGLILLCLTSVLGLGYEGFKIYDVTAFKQNQRDLLFELSKQEDYDFFILSKLAGRPSRVMVPPERQVEFLQFMAANHMQYTVINDNVGRTIEQQFVENKRQRSNSPKLSTERYYTYDEINEYIEYVASSYPNRVFIKTVGKTYEKRILKTITITNGDGRSNKKIIFVDGGFHAREWISPATVLYLIEQLTEDYETNKELLLDYDWVILPVVNADGYEYTQTSTLNRLWRKTRTPHSAPLGLTCYGADPNRNFDFHWLENGASTNSCSDTFAGPTPFSEPETQVVRDLLYSVEGRCKFYLTLHSYGNYLIYPWGWTSDLPETWPDLDEVAMAGYTAIYDATYNSTSGPTEYLVGSSTNVLYAAAGASDDFAFGAANIPISICMELTGGGLAGFDPPPSSIDPYVKEAWIGIRAMALVVVNKY